MRSKDLRELRKAFQELRGSIDGFVKNASRTGRGKKVARKKVSVKNEEFDDEDIDEYDDEDIEDLGDEDGGEDDDLDTESVIETAEAIVDMVESLPDEVEEEVKDQLLSDAADDVEDGATEDEVIENVRRRVFNIRRRVNNARRARIANARRARIANARRRRLFNKACKGACELDNKADAEFQNPISKFKNSRRYRFFNDGASDLDAGLGDDYRDTDPGPSIGSFGRADDDGYGGDPDSNYDPNDRPTGKSKLNTLRNARVRNIINKARAYDALMNSIGGGVPGKVNLANQQEQDAYNQGVIAGSTNNGRYFLYNGRVYTINDNGIAPATNIPDETAVDGSGGNPAGGFDDGGVDIHITPGQDGQLNPEDIEVSVGGQPMDVEPVGGAATGAEDLGYDQMGGGMSLPGEGAAQPPAGPGSQFNARRRGRVRNSRGYRPVYNQQGQQPQKQTRIALRATPKKKEEAKETQVNNSVPETGLDIPSTFPNKKAE